MIEDSLEKYFWVMLKKLKGYFSNDYIHNISNYLLSTLNNYILLSILLKKYNFLSYDYLNNK